MMTFSTSMTTALVADPQQSESGPSATLAIGLSTIGSSLTLASAILNRASHSEALWTQLIPLTKRNCALVASKLSILATGCFIAGGVSSAMAIEDKSASAPLAIAGVAIDSLGAAVSAYLSAKSYYTMPEEPNPTSDPELGQTLWGLDNGAFIGDFPPAIEILPPPYELVALDVRSFPICQSPTTYMQSQQESSSPSYPSEPPPTYQESVSINDVP